MQKDTVLGLLNQGKFVYSQESTEIKREEFEAQVIIHQLVFGDRGLADTLGPTWSMIHDPRFIKIENSFIRFRQGRLGGDASTGQTKQLSDGSFNTSIEDLNQYSEILGEGRHLCCALRSMAYYRAIIAIWPNRVIEFPVGEQFPGIGWFNQMNREEQEMVEKLAANYTDLMPNNFYLQPDRVLWDLIRQECPNYFNPRTASSNPTAHQLFKMLRLDLLGLIDDYAEVANLQEWVLLDDENTLVEPHHIEMNAPRVWAEVEMLERALTFRASLRSTAAAILAQLGINKFIKTINIELTDFERDELLAIVYRSKYPDGQAELISQVAGWLGAIQASGKSTEERDREQCQGAVAKAKAFVADLKSGARMPINRVTDPGEEFASTEEQKLADAILHDPIKQMLFLRWTGAEEAADKAATKHEADRYHQMAELLAPVFRRADTVVTEDAAHALLMQCEELVPTRRMNVVEIGAEDLGNNNQLQ